MFVATSFKFPSQENVKSNLGYVHRHLFAILVGLEDVRCQARQTTLLMKQRRHQVGYFFLLLLFNSLTKKKHHITPHQTTTLTCWE